MLNKRDTMIANFSHLLTKLVCFPDTGQTLNILITHLYAVFNFIRCQPFRVIWFKRTKTLLWSLICIEIVATVT